MAYSSNLYSKFILIDYIVCFLFALYINTHYYPCTSKNDGMMEIKLHNVYMRVLV